MAAWRFLLLGEYLILVKLLGTVNKGNGRQRYTAHCCGSEAEDNAV